MSWLHGCTSLYVEELLVESLCHLLLQVSVHRLVLHQLLHLCKPLHDSQVHDGIGGGYEAAVSLARRILRVYEFQVLWWHAPVAVFVAGDDIVVHIFRADMVHPFLYVRICIDGRLFVAVVPV